MFTIKISIETAKRIVALTELRVTRMGDACFVKVSADQIEELRYLGVQI